MQEKRLSIHHSFSICNLLSMPKLSGTGGSAFYRDVSAVSLKSQFEPRIGILKRDPEVSRIIES